MRKTMKYTGITQNKLKVQFRHNFFKDTLSCSLNRNIQYCYVFGCNRIINHDFPKQKAYRQQIVSEIDSPF